MADKTPKENPMSESETYKAGLAVRKKVLGEKYVNESLANADDFMQPLQKFLTENAWGTVWVRDGLSLKTRSMLNLAMLTALNRPNELKLHIKGALNNGVTQDEMREIFLQCGVYCGAPAALDSFKIAQQVFKEEAGNKPQ
jgi:4-carboxymuconolactone decarboxylase